MQLSFRANFDNLEEMLFFTDKLRNSTTETSLQTVLERINQMANTEVQGIISNMQAGFASLNEQQARSSAALDRVLDTLANMPARIQEAVDEAVANGVDPAQIAALTELQAAVQTEVDEARAEADRLEAASPAAVNPDAGGGTGGDTVAGGDTGGGTPTDGGSDTTGGGAPVPQPGA